LSSEGIDVTWLTLGHHECFARFTANREFDLSELSFAKFAAQVSREQRDIIGLPVICSRLFRFYMRGWMHNEMGVKLTDVQWYQAGAAAPGREEKVELNLPPGVSLTRISHKSLSEMLAAHEIDCAIIARPPTCFLEGHPDVVRLFPDYLEMEEAYYT
jgi:4,5-dihydroxyphthalate decarboxylase